MVYKKNTQMPTKLFQRFQFCSVNDSKHIIEIFEYEAKWNDPNQKKRYKITSAHDDEIEFYQVGFKILLMKD